MPQKTKGEHINAAYSKLRISGITVNPTPGDNETALYRLEDFIAECEGRNICLNYNFEEEPNPATRSGIDKQFNEMVSSNLAVRLMPDFGKGLKADPVLLRAASGSLSNACARTAKVNPSVRSRISPVGSGNYIEPFDKYQYQPDPAPISCKTEVLEKEITRSYSESWIDFLNPDTAEEISSFTIESSGGLNILSSAINADLDGVDFTVTATTSGWQRVIIQIVTTDSTPNKADERVINFNVTDNTVNVG